MERHLFNIKFICKLLILYEVQNEKTFGKMLSGMNVFYYMGMFFTEGAKIKSIS